MDFVNLENIDKKPLEKATPQDVREFLDEHVMDMLLFMKNTDIHPFPLVYLHALQVGLPYNIVVCLRNPKNPTIIINPSFLVQDDKYIVSGQEVCDSFFKDDKVKRVFLTERGVKILAMYDEFTSIDEELIPGSEEIDDMEAILYQQMCDISEGKLITRFPEIIDTEYMD